MSSLKRKIKNERLFLKRDAKLEERLKMDYIDNGIATLPAKVTGMDDIISHYSVEGYETLSPEFADYIESTAAFIPAHYPINLEISGCRFSEKEQEIIKRTIHEDYLYNLGGIQADNRRQLIFTILMLVGALITGLLIFTIKGISSTAIEMTYIFFWFFADMVASFCFIDGIENKKKRLLAGRLADMTVYFSEKYDDSNITDEEAKAIYDEIERVTYSQ